MRDERTGELAGIQIRQRNFVLYECMDEWWIAWGPSGQAKVGWMNNGWMDECIENENENKSNFQPLGTE